MKGKRVGFIGLGAMGLPMAQNLLKKGFELHVTAHSNRAPVEALRSEGAIVAGSLPEVAANCDILISILPADREMLDVLLSDDVLGRLNGECILIEMTSGSPAVMKQIHEAYAEKGIRVLDAPVSGGTAGAENGTLTVMAGGQEDVLEACRPVLEAMARSIYLVGAVGAGKAIKAINQMLAAVHMVAAAEALAMAERLEIEPDMLKQVIGSSSGSSWMLMNKLDNLAKRDFTPGFKHRLMKKDIQIAASEGKGQALPMASLALQLFTMTEKEFGDRDFSAIGTSILS